MLKNVNFLKRYCAQWSIHVKLQERLHVGERVMK